MQARVVSLWCAVCCAATLGCTATYGQTQAGSWRTLKNDTVGYSLAYPRAWKVARRVVATQFAAGATCQSVRFVDRAGSAEIRQSLVQLCWRPRDSKSLDAFMQSTYGRRLSALFARAKLGGVPAWRSKTGKRNRTFFLQTKAYRLQVVANVGAGPLRRALRQAQVNRILASLSVKG